MLREISAGGVVVRPTGHGWDVAVIEPQRKPANKPSDKKRHKEVLALPKGLVDSGEKPEHTAIREVHEETGVTATIVTKLTDIKYVYVRSWSDKQRVFKIVSFYLLRHESGEIGDISDEMKLEVRRAMWIPLGRALRELSYGGERDAVKLAQRYLEVQAKERPDGKNRS